MWSVSPIINSPLSLQTPYTMLWLGLVVGLVLPGLIMSASANDYPELLFNMTLPPTAGLINSRTTITWPDTYHSRTQRNT